MLPSTTFMVTSITNSFLKNHIIVVTIMNNEIYYYYYYLQASFDPKDQSSACSKCVVSDNYFYCRIYMMSKREDIPKMVISGTQL